jgi:hypothetical protein
LWSSTEGQIGIGAAASLVLFLFATFDITLNETLAPVIMCEKDNTEKITTVYE